MKQKQFVMTIVAAVMTTYSYADVLPVAMYGNTAPLLYLADASSTMQQPSIQGRTAGGESQTTIIDGNGNLKIVDPSATPAAPEQGPTSNNMSGSNPGAMSPNTQAVTPDTMPNAVSPNDSVPSSSPENAAEGNAGIAPNNVTDTNPDMAPANPGAAPAVGR